MTLSPNDNDRLWKESEKTSWFHFPGPWRYIMFLIFLVALLIGLWILMAPNYQWYDKVDLPLIRADQTPYKIKAENQGVPSVKHQDKLIYGRIRSDHNEPVAEHILPDPEEPLPQIKEEGVAIKMVDQYEPEEIDPDKNVEIQEESKAKKTTLTSIVDLIEEDSREAPSSKKTVAKGKVLIQLGSLKSYDMAESEWKRLSKKHPDILNEREPIIQKVDLGAKQGIYYRLRMGPFEDVETANKVCSTLKERTVGCLVIP